MLNIEHLNMCSTFQHFSQMFNIFNKCSTFFSKVVDKFEHLSDLGSKLIIYFVMNSFKAKDSVD